MEDQLIYCNSRGVIESGQDFSSHQAVVRWSGERIEELARLALKEQLKQRRILRVILKPLQSALALLVPNVFQEGTFCLMVDSRCPLEWPMCIGHELAHTNFYRRDSSRLRRLNGWSRKEEEVCDIFAEIWTKEKGNYTEVYEFLGPISSQGGTIEIY